MSPGLGGASRSWEGEPWGPASTPGVEPVSPVSCGLQRRGAGDEPLTWPRVLSPSGQELARQPVQMGPGGQGGPGLPCVPSPLGSCPGSCEASPGLSWLPGVRVLVSRVRRPHARLTPGVYQTTAVLTWP